MKNETSHFEQAISEAKSKWNVKKQMNYVENIDEVSNINNSNIRPMLALKYNDRCKDIVFPCYVQPKLDGVRAIYKDGLFYSRNGNIFPSLKHISNELKETKLILDGELYSHTLNFQEIISIITKKKTNEEDEENKKKIHYVVFDIVLQEDYITRYQTLLKLFSKKFKYTSLIQTEICKKRELVNGVLNKYIKMGYEGLMIRNFIGKYTVKHRSRNLQKLKKFIDSEYMIISFHEGTGKENGLVMWRCITEEGREFNVRPKGTYEERETWFKEGNKYIGKYLTVKYQEMTTDNIPRFPVGIVIRDYE